MIEDDRFFLATLSALKKTRRAQWTLLNVRQGLKPTTNRCPTNRKKVSRVKDKVIIDSKSFIHREGSFYVKNK